jgi:hypothetical protein
LCLFGDRCIVSVDDTGLWTTAEEADESMASSPSEATDAAEQWVT